ncbi:MAG: DUF1080 domain-containing protein [Tannerellaceae bacterium]|nr:DUF1080 domain-containing protein [Tannerellaceae bacterium]
MKKIFLTYILFLFTLGVFAQSPGNRTAQTVTADVLAQLPAANQRMYNQLMNDLASTGTEGVVLLVNMFQPSGTESNAQIEYALAGLSRYVMEEGKESLRQPVATGYIQALQSNTGKDTRSFIIRQLQMVGKAESIEPLAGLLSDPDLGGPAARALASIGTPAALEKLKEAVTSASQTRNDILLAIAEAGIETDASFEQSLHPLLSGADENSRKVILYTLGKTGSSLSLSVLATAAERTGYRMETGGATDAYLLLLNRVAGTTDKKEIQKQANDLLKKAGKANQTHARIAALGILLSASDEVAANKLVLGAMKDPDAGYRNAALLFASGFATERTYIELLKYMQKARPEVKTDILNWTGREATCPEKNPVLKNLELRFDLTAREAISAQLQKQETAVKKAAAWALTKIGDEASIPTLAALLADPDQEIIRIGKACMLAFNGNVAHAVARTIPSATDNGQIAATEVLAARKANPHVNTVLELIRSGSPAVKEAAYLSLKDLVTYNHFVTICGMLESSPAEAISPLQQAVISSISSLPVNEQLSVVNTRMVQAGTRNKHLYYIVLASTGTPQALQTIVQGFNQDNAQGKEAAFEALTTWKGSEAADELFTIASTDSQYATRALNSYIRLASHPSLTGENRLLKLREAMAICKEDSQKNRILKEVERTGTFLALMYAGEFLDKPSLQQAAANAVMNIALSHPEYNGQNVRALLEKVSGILDNPDAAYQREAIRKHLNELPTEEGFVSIFNGKDLTGWKGLVGNPLTRAKMPAAQLAKAQAKADEQMRKDWKVEDGLLVFDGTGYDNLCTIKQYGDIEMYVDWRLDPAGPEADGGIYLRGTPQVQIWDIARVNVGAQVGSGGLYNNQTHESKPLKVADNKMGEWNTFYIRMTGDRVTVKLNGELVTDDIILENFWDRSQPIFPMEQLELQAHGSKVYYRNIYVKEIPRPEPFQLSAEEEKEGYKVLFDGTHMHEWIGNTVDYTIQDGCISLIPSKGSGGNLYTKKEYGNFVIRFEFELTPAANNGLGIRTPMEGDAAYVGMELQILDNEHPVYKDLADYQYHGSVYGIIPAKRGYLKPVGEWNYQEVVANGDHIKITLNGEVILDGNIREAVQNGIPDGKEHPGLFNRKGHIGFLGHGSPVKFRNIRIKELK